MAEYKEIYRSFDGKLDVECRWGYTVEEKEGGAYYRIKEFSVYPGGDCEYYVLKKRVKDYRNYDDIVDAMYFSLTSEV